MKRLVLALLLFSIPSLLVAENRGVSHLGLCHNDYDCAFMMKTFAGAPTIRTGWLDLTFNSKGCKCLPSIISDKRPKEIRVHILNGSGLRNGRLQRFELGHGQTVRGLEKLIVGRNPAFLRAFDRRVRLVRRQLDSINMLQFCAVSPVLESDFYRQARLVLLRRTARLAPSCSLVDNPLRFDCAPGYICEKHGDFKRLKGSYIADLDGTDHLAVNRRRWADEHSSALMTLTWTYCNNLNLPKGREFLAPELRQNTCDPIDAAIQNEFVLKGR